MRSLKFCFRPLRNEVTVLGRNMAAKYYCSSSCCFFCINTHLRAVKDSSIYIFFIRYKMTPLKTQIQYSGDIVFVLFSSHLPLYLVAAFAKRLARLALTAPPTALLIVLPFIYNLIRRHPSCKILVHKPTTQDGQWIMVGFFKICIFTYLQLLRPFNDSMCHKIIRFHLFVRFL